DADASFLAKGEVVGVVDVPLRVEVAPLDVAAQGEDAGWGRGRVGEALARRHVVGHAFGEEGGFHLLRDGCRLAGSGVQIYPVGDGAGCQPAVRALELVHTLRTGAPEVRQPRCQ